MTEQMVASELSQIVVVETPGLGNRSYLLHDDSAAIVVDPQRDASRYVEVAETLGVQITHVFETHIHNDYVSGGLALSRQCGADYEIAKSEEVQFRDECKTLAVGETLTSGSIAVTALATPGHTPNHISFLVHRPDSPPVLFSGGSMLFGGAGRTDLFGQRLARELATAQWRSVRGLSETVPPETILLPTHGFGSFCSSQSNLTLDLSVHTVEMEARKNPAINLTLEEFVDFLEAETLPTPAFYEHMGRLNREGQGADHLGPLKVASPDEIIHAAAQGAWIVDVRPRRKFATRHEAGTINMELGSQLATYFGWLVPFHQPFILLGDTTDEVFEACHSLSNIGRGHPNSMAIFDSLLPAVPTGTYPVANFADLAQRIDSGELLTVIDVRHLHEWRSGHIALAQHIPISEFVDAIDELPRDRSIWVHCQAGYRAAIAASLLAARGYRAVLIDDDFSSASEAGLRIVLG